MNDVVDRPGMVGRSTEIEAITCAIDSLKSGRGRMLMLAGEPGIGKSTLARLASELAQRNSVSVYWGFAWEAGGAPAYWPWTQILEALINEQEPGSETTANLRQLLPGMDSESPDTRLQPDQARFQLLESVRRLLKVVSERAPLLLILEDLHAADSDSLQLLQYIAQHVATLRLVIIGTYRDIEARNMAAAEPLWRTCRDAEILRLERLNENDVRDYLQARGGEQVSDKEVRNLFVTTDGNPLFLTELIGLLAKSDSSEMRLPANVQQVIQQQIALLPAASGAAMAKAAILGREFSVDSLVAVSDMGHGEISALMSAPVAAGLLLRKSEDWFRFSHGLHRDVLYQAIEDSERLLLHLKYATYLRRLIEDGDEDRWAELAEHLSAAGGENRDAAISAWRHAAKRALKRLAFEDAILSLNKALNAFGEGPRYDPAERYKLLLECAEAAHLTGDTETGHRYCRDAFEIARTLEDATLMSEAALVWGSVIVVARVDTELIAALQESLAAAPDEDTALRARVLARLAGALQPAPNPAGPMDMAREAIALARSTGDKNVMYQVLRYAISALMDFAPADERLKLNEEFGDLARKTGDIPGQFRSKLRLMIDACEMADRHKMDQAIDDCNRLADRIDLPHYKWRAASARAMQATIDGDFSRATSLLDTAEKYATQVDDLDAGLTLSLQRFVILIEWDAKAVESLEQIQTRLSKAYSSGLADAEIFVAPFIATYIESPDTARQLLANREIVERTFTGGDRFSLCRLAEMAATAGSKEIARRACDALAPFAEGCATPGLMGSSCIGPTAWSIGVATSSLGHHDDALRRLHQALDCAEAMRAPPWIARIHRSIADVAYAAGDNELAAKHAERSDRLGKKLGLRKHRSAPTGQHGETPRSENTTRSFTLQREGDLWRVSYGEESAMHRQSKGFEMLAKLIEKPEAEIHVLDLSGGDSVRRQGDAGPHLDPKARRAYEQRIEELREELEEAEEFGDSGRADAAREEIGFITKELSRAFGLSGRSRPAGDAAERARVNVRRRLKDAIERIAGQNPEAGRYLENTIKTGTYCRYTPM